MVRKVIDVEEDAWKKLKVEAAKTGQKMGVTLSDILNKLEDE